MTRDCYKQAYDLLVQLEQDRRDGSEEAYDQLRLCHGYPRLTRADGEVPAGTKYGHAWVEGLLVLVGTPVWFAIPSCPTDAVPAAMYRTAGRVNDSE